MAKKSTVIDVTLQATDKVSGKLARLGQNIQKNQRVWKKQSKNLQKFGRKTEKIGASITKSLTVPLAGAAVVGVKKFAEVDKTMQLTNKTMGNTEAESELLSNAMKKAAANSVFGMNDAATASLNFARAGLSAKEAAETLAPAMNLAAGEGGELDTVSAGLVATIRGFKGSFGQATDYADVFANACNNSALDIEGLSTSMSIAAPVFSAAGYSVNDAALYMGTMANAGINANKAANSLKTGLARLVSPAKQGQEWMDRLRFSITNADGSMKSSAEVQRQLHGAFSKLSESEQIAAASAIFGKNQMSNWLALIKTSPEEVAGLSKALGTEGTTAQMADSMMSGFGGTIEKLKSSLDVAATILGEKLSPYIKKATGLVQKATEWFNSLDKKQLDLIVKIGMVIAAIGPALLIGGKVISLIGTLIPVIKTLKAVSLGALWETAAAAMANPITWIILAVVAAVVLLGVIIKKNWDKIKPVLDGVMAKVKEIWENNIKPVVQAVWTKIKETWEKIKPVIRSVWTKIKETWEKIKPTFIKVIQIVIKVYATAYKIIFKIIAFVARLYVKIFGYIGKFIVGVVHFIKNLVQKIKELKGKLVSVFIKIKNSVMRILQPIIDLFNGFKNAISGVIEKLGNSKLVQWIKGKFNKNLSLGENAKGTNYWRGGLTWVGEKGPELVSLPRGSKVFPHEKSVQLFKSKTSSITNKNLSVGESTFSIIQPRTISALSPATAERAAGERRISRRAEFSDNSKAGERGNITISIPKLAETIIVREESDIDKIAEALALKLQRTAANF